MSDKPIIDIQVRSADFDRFLALYEGYSNDLDEQPKKWAAINDAMGNATTSVAKGFNASSASIALAKTQALDLSKSISGATKAQSSFASAIGLSEKQFSSLGKASVNTVQGVTKAFSGAVSGSVAEMGAGFAGVAEGALSALGPVGIAVGAIAGAIGGAAFGLYKLADAAVSRQRSAFSLGITPGLQSSFEINAQQFLGSGSLEAARNAQLSYASGGALATLGIGFDEARKMSPADLAFKMLEQATKAAQAQPNTPLENIPAIAQYQRLGGDVGDVQNALKMGLPALEAARKATNANATRLSIDQGAVAQSAALKKSVESAGVTVQSAAINRLSGADPIIANALGALTGDKSAAASVSHAFANVVHTVTQNVEPAFKHVAATVAHNVQPALHALQSGAHNAAAALQSVWHSLTMPVTGAAAAATAVAKKRGMYVTDDATYAKASAAIVKAAKKKGVDPVLALADALQESNLNPNLYYMDHYADGSNAGYSAGLYSLNQNGEGAGMSLKSMKDPGTNASVALSEFASVMGMSAKQIAAREATQGLDKWWSHDASKLTPGQVAALAERPADMQGYSHLVDALYQALMKANAATQRKQPKAGHSPHITVRNSTAARVSVSANAVAAG